MMIDKFGRKATDLRVSVTDRCNYRCVYCMPLEVQWMPKSEILSFEEIVTLVRLFAREGVRQLRLTGGEPLVRRNLPVLVRQLRAVEGIEEISLTTNAYYLKEQASELKAAGIDRINISLDSLRADRFAEITRSNSFGRVMEGIEAAKHVGFSPIKVNCVAIRDFNDDEVIDFLKWASQNDLEMRFIEYMPLDGDHKWNRLNVLSKKEILEIVARYETVAPVAENEIAPASKYQYAEGRRTFGVIPSVTDPFCANCTRIRLTADGKFRNCLFALEETDLKGPLRAGKSEEELIQIMKEAVLQKWAGHKINEPDFQQPARAMNAIGG